MLEQIKKDLRKRSDPKKAALYARFFKSGPGEYGEGDQFIGCTVPKTRSVAKKYKDLQLSDIKKLLHSPIHEERLCALMILKEQFRGADEFKQEKIYNFYLDNTKYINNWDLIDLSATYIVGPFIENRSKDILKKLARSESVWERRIAVLSTFHFIKLGEPKYCYEIAEILMQDKHDLIHKAVGWMLREVGKRIDEKKLRVFLDKHYSHMPRTMLRYAIERFPEQTRQKYLKR